MLYVQAACASSVGKVRADNEDNFLFDGKYLSEKNNGQPVPLTFKAAADETCFAVFDGMGGWEHGECASYTAASTLDDILNSFAISEDAAGDLERICQILNTAVFDRSEELGCDRMGTTAAIIYIKKNTVYACNIGDSKIFLMRSGKVSMLSHDDTNEAFLKARGIEGRRPTITQYLGTDPSQVRIEPNICQHDLRKGDQLMICSDGLTDMICQERISLIMQNASDPCECVDCLVKEAERLGGKDNITAIVCLISSV